MFNFLRPLFLIILIMMFTSCVAKSGPEGSGAGTNGTVNPTKASNISPAAFDEDTESIISLSYTDADGNLASSCTTSSLTNVSVTRGCACSAGVCTVGVKGTRNFNGAASFRYQAVVNGVTSANGLASLTINAINSAPTMVAIAAQSTNKNAVKVVSFKIADVDSTLTCASSVTATSSNLTLIPLANIVLAGTVPNCTATITPASNLFGTSDIQLTVTDGVLIAAQTFTLTVVNYNYPPTISFISNVTTNEDSAVAVNFVLDDIDSATPMVCSSANLSVFSSSNGTLIPGVTGSDVVFSGTYPNCTATFTPSLNQNGSSNIIIRANDNGTGVPASATGDSNTFKITVTSVDDAPVANNFSPAAFNEDIQSIITLSYADVDNDNATVCTISNPTNVTVSQACGCTAGVCTVGVTGLLNYNGAASFNFTVTANGATSNSGLVSLTITGVNDAPTIAAIAAQTTNEDLPTGAIAFTINDMDSTLSCATSITGTSSNTAVLANSGIVFGGTAPNCTVTLIPVANGNGITTVTLTVSDGFLTAQSVFSLTVSPVNDAPTISFINAQTTNENTTTSPIAFTINDVDSTLSCATSVTGASSDTAVFANAGIVFGGTAPNCTVTLSPVALASGTSTITLTVTDGPLTAQSVFVLTVTPINNAPTISAIAFQSTNEDTATGAIAFTIDDVDSTLSCAASLTGTSSNTAVLANTGIVFGGTAPNCTVTLTPVANGNGSATVTLTVTDGLLTAQSIFALTVNPVNDAPTVGFILNATTNEDTSVNVDFVIDDADSSPAMTCTSTNLAIFSSSNGALILGIVGSDVNFSGTYPNCRATFVPVTNANGTSNIVIRVSDNGAPTPVKTVDSNIFTITVNAVNDAPTISAIVAQSTNEDTATGAIAFTINDIDSTLSCTASLTAVSSNTALVANAGVVFGGTAPNCTATITPLANANGATTITITVTDGGLTAQSVFALTVVPVDDPPVITPSGLLPIGNQTIDEDTSTSALTFTVSDIDSPVACSNVTGTSSNQALIANAGIVIGGGAGTSCTVTITPVANANGNGTVITLTVGVTTSTFIVNLTPVLDITGSLTVDTNLSGVASAYLTGSNYYSRKLNFLNSITVDEAISNLEVCLGTSPTGCETVGWTALAVGAGTNQYSTSGVAPTLAIAGNYQFSTANNGVFVLNHSCSVGATTNYYFSVRITNASGKKVTIDSVPWSFWEPICLGSTVLTQWLDASETSTITGISVSAWNDKTTNLNHVSQATAASQPAYSATGLGGTQPGITFNGTSDTLTRASFVYAQGSASVFAMMSAPAVGALKYVFSEGSGTNGYYAPLMNNANPAADMITGRLANDTAVGGALLLSTPTTTAAFFDNTVKFVMIEDTGANFTAYNNGVSGGGAAYTRETTTVNLFCLGARFRANIYSSWFNGTMSEFMIINGTLSPADRQKLEGYSAHKWGVNANLPVAHPYLLHPPAN